MRKTITLAAALLVSVSLAQAQSGHSPHAQQEQGEIKSLSPEEIQAYLSGEGDGLAKAAELNHYPGPKHVLDSAESLQLSKDQIRRITAVYDKLHQQAVALGRSIVAKERSLDTLFATRKIDKAKLQFLVFEIAALQGKLRAAHLMAHLEMQALLFPEQVAKYDELRGYTQDNKE